MESLLDNIPAFARVRIGFKILQAFVDDLLFFTPLIGKIHDMGEDAVERVRASFARQGLMVTLGATLEHVSPGAVEVALCPHPAISQQHGFIHAGAVCAIADTAAGYAALTLMPPGRGVLTTEFKINLLAPATGDRLVARARVIKESKRLTLAQTDVIAETDGKEKLIAYLTATMMAIEGRESISD